MSRPPAAFPTTVPSPSIGVGAVSERR